MADVSSRKERADMAWYRINQQIPNVAAMYEREVGLDLATAATDLKMSELAHQAILSTTARLLPQSLLNFLR
jgi:flagellin-like hook-associated protein FlgL